MDVDHFTKWAEAELLATISAIKLKDFVFKSIVCRYGVPYKLISKNGNFFDSMEIRGLCDDLGIYKSFSVVCHPQSNGQTEAMNKIIKHTLKTKLEESKGNWSEQLSKVLWSYNTTVRSTTGESPFSLTYGCEAMVLVEIGVGFLKRDNYNPNDNEVKLATYQQRTRRCYNSKVRALPLKVGDLVLRKVMPNTKVLGHGVFRANWEGTYKIKSVLWEGTCHLTDMDGKLIPRAWNAEYLKKYYQ